MSGKFRIILLIGNMLFISIGGCAAPCNRARGILESPEVEQPAQGKSVTVPEGEVSEVDQAGKDEVGKAEQGIPGYEERTSETVPEKLSDEKERDAILDRVNLGGPIIPGGSVETGTVTQGAESKGGGN